MIADRSEEGWEDEDGTLAVSYEAMGKIMSETGIYDADPGKRAKRGADDLAEAGMITVTKGTLEIEDERYIPQPDSIRYEWVPNENKRSPRKFVKRQVENPGYYEEEKDDWVDPPTIQIIPELRGRDSRTPLGSFTPFTSPAERRWRKTLFPLAA
jgi:hypothetical protein